MAPAYSPFSWDAGGKYEASEDRYYVTRTITNLNPTSMTISWAGGCDSCGGSGIQRGYTTTNPFTDLNSAPVGRPATWTNVSFSFSASLNVAAGQTIWVMMRSGVGSANYGIGGSETLYLHLNTSPENLSWSSASSDSSDSSSSTRDTNSLGSRSESSRSFSSGSSASTRSSPSSPTLSISSASSAQSASSASSRSQDSSRSPI